MNVVTIQIFHVGQYKKPRTTYISISRTTKNIILALLKDLANSLGINEQIEWVGKIDDVPSIVNRAKVFILTSRWEGLSIALLEAMTAGCVPVVSADAK